jgi:hypothetical protein
MTSDMAAEVLREWQRQRGEEFRAHFERAYSYLSGSIRELASDEATWTIAPYADHPVLLLAGGTAFALVAFSGPPDGVTINGALHPLDEGVVRVSFNDRLADADLAVPGMPGIRPMIRQWSFDWHGRLQLPIEHWVLQFWPPVAGPGIDVSRRHHERQRAMARKLARAAGWPMPADDSET